ncbi:MAG: hypothetical protein KBD47_00065 [Candidatus Pacebacteria bacterium]|jgi:hypothetical protein|nr:hypothetical protein [Candidatus Paceibacterota bacterium]
MKKFIKQNIVAFILFNILYSLLFLSFVFIPDSRQTSLFPAQYFQDVGSSVGNLSASVNSIFVELTYSNLASGVMTVFIVIIPVCLLVTSVLFFRRNRTLWVIPLFIIFCTAYIISLVLTPQITTIPTLFSYATQNLKRIEPSYAGSIADPEKIKSILSNSPQRVEVISGYGNYNEAVNILTAGKLNQYKTMIVPTAAIHLAWKEGSETIRDDMQALYYYPETHRLVVNRLDGLDSFIEFLSIDMISDIGNEQLKKLVIKKGNPDEYRIVQPQEYAKYYIDKIKQNNRNNINSDLAIKNKNLAVVKDCETINAENTKLIVEQKTDYQLNCVSRVRYSDCADFKLRIDENVEISRKTNLSCVAEIAKVKKYNAEIDMAVKTSVESIREIDTSGTLERNKAEQGTGVFIYPSTIYIKSDPFTHAIIPASVHEFLHYITSTPSRDLPVSVDEGMTDYLTLRSLGYDKYLTVAYSGYYAEIQILYSLLEKIPFDEMVGAYIAGSESGFRKLFEKYFPGVSYEKFISLSTDVYNTTYKFKGNERVINALGDREYIWTQDVVGIRRFLGLEDFIWYSNPNNNF